MPRILQPVLLLLALGMASAAGAEEPLRVNPFVPPPAAAAGAAAQAEGNGMELRGIVLAGRDSFADIGGRIVGVGQDIDGYRVVVVEEHKVLLERNGSQRVLELRAQDGAGKDVHANGTW